MTYKYHPVQLAKLERLCDEATPGPWHDDDGNVFDGPTSDILERRNEPQTDALVATTEQRRERSFADAEFIAAFNPKTCKRLIRWIRAAERNEWAHPVGEEGDE